MTPKEKEIEFVDKFGKKLKAIELVDRYGKKLAITTVNNWIASNRVDFPIDYLEGIKIEIEKL
jgi:hypothetical protein